MLALIKDNTVVQTAFPGQWLYLSDIDGAVSAAAGWEAAPYRLAEIQPTEPVPEGKQIASTSVELVNGEPRYVHVLEDVPPPPVPDRVSRRQFKMQLAISGLSEQVTTWVAAQDELVQIAFNESGEFVRQEPMMQAGFAALDFTPEQIDAFFVAAAAL